MIVSNDSDVRNSILRQNSITPNLPLTPTSKYLTSNYHQHFENTIKYYLIGQNI